MDQDGGRRELTLKEAESLLGLWLPGEPHLGGGQVSERCGDGVVAPDEPPIKIGESQESLEGLPVGGSGPLLHRSHLLGVHGDAAGGDDVAGKCCGGAQELAFLGLDEQPVLEEVLEDLADVTLVRPSILGENQDVIQINKYELVDHVPLDVVHQGLEDSRRVREPEQHDEVLPVPRWRVKGCLSLVALLYPHQVIGIPEVQLGEDGRPLQVVKRRVH